MSEQGRQPSVEQSPGHPSPQTPGERGPAEHALAAADRCPYCHVDVAPDQPRASCDTCTSWHHAECWEEFGACAACAAQSVGGHEPFALRCTWSGWTGRAPECQAPGTRREGSQIVFCPAHARDFERGRRRVGPLVLIVLGLACLAGSAALANTILRLSPIPGLYVAATGSLASAALYMLWLAWSRWPSKEALLKDPKRAEVEVEEVARGHEN